MCSENMSKADLKKVLRVVKRAKKLISSPSTWTRNTLARDSRGKEVFVNSSSACRFCALGAVKNSAYVLFSKETTYWEKYEGLALSLLRKDGPPISVVNDGKNGRKTVLAHFNKVLKEIKI